MPMYIQTIPLPSLEVVFGISGSRHEEVGAPWKVGRDNHIHLFPRGSRALAEAARVVAKGPARPICFFPAYFCNGSLVPLREAGARIVFYRVTRELEPNWDDVRRRAKALRPDLFVLVHTFGLVQDAAEALVFAKESGCVVLEDAAHVLTPHGDMGARETIVLFSSHKLLALPPISLLSVPDSLTNRIQTPYKVTWRQQDWKWLAKRLIQKGIVAFGGLGIKAKPRAGGFEGNEGGDPPCIDYPCEISRLGSRLLLAEQRHLAEIARLRRDNFSFLARAFAETPDVEIPKPFAGWTDNATATPYAFPFFVGEERAPGTYLALWRLGIPVQTWPDLPPEVANRPEEYPEAQRWRKHLLLLPVHQSLTSRQMEAMGAALRKALLPRE